MGPWSLVVHYYINTPLFDIILYIYFIYYFIYFIYYFIYFLRALSYCVPSMWIQNRLFDSSNNFEADFLNFNIFHRFSPKTYFWGPDGGGDDDDGGRISSNLQPPFPSRPGITYPARAPALTPIYNTVKYCILIKLDPTYIK